MSTSTIKLNIGRKLLIITLLSLAGMIITLFLFYQGLQSSLMQEKKHQSQRLSDAGIGIIRHFHALASSGILVESDAINMAKNVLKAATYGTDGYFWINDGSGILLMQPYTPELVGRNLLWDKDIKGKYLFQEVIVTAKKGGGWVQYYWPKPKKKESYQKISYVVYFEPWDFVLGTGLYLDNMKRDIRHNALRAVGVVFFLTVILALFSLFLTKKFMRQIKEMAIHDPLTTLYTRHLLNETMENLILRHDREKNYLSVVFLDIDHFKNINDTHGHSCGDKVLAIVGKIIKNITRPNDLCIRYGGEEFVIIVFSKEKETAVVLAERIRKKVSDVVFHNKSLNFSVTLSAGIASRKPTESLEGILNRADEYLYKAKERGRNQVVY